MKPTALMAPTLLCLTIFLSDPFWPSCSGASNPLDRWSWRNPIPGAESYNGVAWAGTHWMVVGSSGVILSSPDGVNWIERASGAASLQSIAYSENVFVAVGTSSGVSTVLTSPDAVSWSPRSLPDFYPEEVKWVGNQFVVVGSHGGSATSPDGVAWTVRTTILGTAPFLTSVANTPGTLVAVGGNGAIRTSPDGVTWTSRTSGGTESLNSVARSSTVFAAVGSAGTVRTSPDGVTWTKRTSTTTQTLNCVAFSGGILVAVGENGAIQTSDNGTTWTSRTSGVTSSLMSIAWNGSQFVATGINGIILSSADGLSWTKNSHGVTSANLSAVTTDGPLTVAVGQNGTILTSPDGIAWTVRASGTAQGIFGIVWNGQRFAAVGAAGVVLTSDDGITWTSRSSVTTENLYEVVWRGGQFVAVGSGGAIITTPDGITWTARTSGTTATLGALAWGAGKYVASGIYGPLLTSTEGVTWTKEIDFLPYGQSGPTSISSVVWTDTQFLAVGAFGSLLTSPDGVTWTPGTGPAGIFNAVVYRGGLYVAVGINGAVASSSDGLAWVTHRSRTSLTGVAMREGRFIAVGELGAILESDVVARPPIVPPVVNTLAATEISISGAKLNATINPRGADSTVHFEYGPTEMYGSATAPTTLSAGAASVSVGHSISGLAGGATYHFRAVANNSAGRTEGNDATLKTFSADPLQVMARSNRLEIIGHRGVATAIEMAFDLAPPIRWIVHSFETAPAEPIVFSVPPDVGAQRFYRATTSPGNRPPVLNPIANRTAIVEAPVTVIPTASDPDQGQNVTFSLAPGASSEAQINPTTGALSFIPPRVGYFTFTILATDSGSPALTVGQTFTVTAFPQGQRTLVDMFAARTVVSAGQIPLTVEGSNVGAGVEPFETVSTFKGTASLWVSFTVPQELDGKTLALDTFGSDFDTVLATYTNDVSGNATLEFVGNDALFAQLRQSRLWRILKAGETFHVAIYGYDGATGNVKLNAFQVPVGDALRASVVGAWSGARQCSGTTLQYGWFLCPGGRVRGAETVSGYDFIVCGTYQASATEPGRIDLLYKATAVINGQVFPNQQAVAYWVEDRLVVGNCQVSLRRLEGTTQDSDCNTGACTSGGTGAVGCGSDSDCGTCYTCDNGTCRYQGEGCYGCFAGWEPPGYVSRFERGDPLCNPR